MRRGGGGAGGAAALDAAAAEAGAAFFWAGVAGPAGWCFADLGPAYTFAPSAAEARGAEAVAAGGGKAGGGGGPPPPPPALTPLPYPPLARALAHPWAGLHPRRTHGLVTALRVAADFEATAGRPVRAGDELALAARAAALAAADGVAPHAAPALVAGAAPALASLAAGNPDTPAVAAVVGRGGGARGRQSTHPQGAPSPKPVLFRPRGRAGGGRNCGGVGRREGREEGRGGAEVV